MPRGLDDDMISPRGDLVAFDSGAVTAVVMMCGLPASGKTTTAGRIHAHAGGLLIRSCDVYQALGISLPAWVERTRGFSVNVHEYDRLRDRAYEEMRRRLETGLDRQRVAILDGVYGERSKREAVYALCRSRGVELALVLCRCDDPNEVARRFERRRGRESVPENEASDPTVFQDIARRWQPPQADRFEDGERPTIITYDTCAGELTVAGADDAPLVRLVRAALDGSGPPA